MNESQILAETKKAIDFFQDNTYTVEDLYSHILAIIKEHSDTGAQHRHQLERLMFKVDEMREAQRMYWAGHKKKLPECKQFETEMDKKIIYLCTHGGYSIERFKQEKPKQSGLF